MSEQTEELGWNPSSVLFGLSRIGYTPHSALADIVDNSITNKAKNVYIKIIKERDDISDSRKNNIKEYLIVDDGCGMDKKGILTALELGSDDLVYDSDSLSKFGLGLKSASFSQGNILQVISSNNKKDDFLKYSVDLSKIKDKYFCSKEDLTGDDKKVIENLLVDGVGTIIRISNIHENNHPSPKKTTEDLKYRLGTIYFYFLNDGVNIYLNDEKIEPFDVLFTDEATGNLNEHEWNGREVKWIKKPSSQTLDIESAPIVKALVEVTQLPHPPTFSVDGEGEQTRIRNFYKIESKNYGYYVYRNKRLISWAEKFEGIIPQDQDFFSFRGRILLDSCADDAFNIDVKKSHITLSDDASNALSDLSDEYKRKSKKAWQHAITLKKQMTGDEPNNKSNDIARSIELPDVLPGEPVSSPADEKIKKEREELLKDKSKKRIKSEAQEFSGDKNITDEELKGYASGSKNSTDKRIYRVQHIQDNLLWEPYYDDDHGWSVRINKMHRFSKSLFEDNTDNSDMQIMFEIFLLQLSHAEISLRKQTKFDEEVIEEVLVSFREVLSNLLAQMLRNNEIKLPPY